MSKINLHKQGYKHTPVGWLPKEWQYFRLDNISDVVRGGSPRPAGDPKFFNGNFIPWLTVASLTNISDGLNEVSQTAGYLTELGSEQSRILEKGTLILSNSGATLGVAKVLGIRCCANDGIAAFINWKEDMADKLFVLYYLNYYTKYFRDVIAPGNGQPNLNTDLIGSTYVPAPKLIEQRTIASILSVWDEAITKAQELIFNLQQRNKALMQQLLAPKEGWKEYRIGDLLKEVKRPVSWDDNELYNLISVRRRSGGAFFRQSLYGKQILTKQLFTAEQGDFLISKMQIVHGASAVVPPQFAGMKISGSYIAVHSKDDNIIDINFFNWLSKTPWFYRLSYISSYGVHIEKMTFDFDDFKRHKMMLPATVEEQKRIVSILQTASDEVKLQEQKLAALQEQKKGLMQKLLTGEIRVKINTNNEP